MKVEEAIDIEINQDSPAVQSNMNQDHISQDIDGEIKQEETTDTVKKIERNSDEELGEDIEQGGNAYVEQELEFFPGGWSIDTVLVVVNILLIVDAIAKIVFYAERYTTNYAYFFFGLGSFIFHPIGTILFSIGTCLLGSWSKCCICTNIVNMKRGILFLEMSYRILAVYFFCEHSH